MAYQNGSDNGPNGQQHSSDPLQQSEQQNGSIVNETTDANAPDGTKGIKQRALSSKPLRALTKKGPPGGYDETPLPDAPQGYTIRFTFQRAVNLPPSDFNMASDPFLTATLKGTQPKRHKQDPDLVHRTPTCRRTTSPEWKDEWVVANVPPTGFILKCRMYDEDYPDRNDRLGNVTLKVPRIYDDWQGIPLPGREFDAKKRMISKRAFFLKGVSSVLSHNFHMTPRLCISMEVLGKSDPPYAQMCTIGPTSYFQHFSPMLGRLTGTKLSAEEEDGIDNSENLTAKEKKSQKYE